MKKYIVTGAGGFIGHHLVKFLTSYPGTFVRGIDVKKPEFEETAANEFLLLDLRYQPDAELAFTNFEDAIVFNLAANMGGIGYITSKLSEIAVDNVRINLNTLEAAVKHRASCFVFSSSACVYPAGKQHDANVTPLREIDAIPADPEPGYGWEKLFTEQLCLYAKIDAGLNARCVRFHNVYGPLGTYDGGREKAPAALCRKIACAKDGDTITVWGDGEQTRSFMYIDDCVEGLVRIAHLEKLDTPLNLGTDRLISINDLTMLIARIAGKRIAIEHDLTGPQGVRGRNSDNSLLRATLKWEPKIDLEEGLIKTYRWIKQELMVEV